MRILKLAGLPVLGAALVLAGDGGAVLNQAMERGRTQTQGATMPPGERERAMAEINRQYSGMLIDAGCPNRSPYNLSLPPESFSVAIAGAGGNANNQPAPGGGVSAFGITVSPQTIQKERADIMPHQVPDMRTRQRDPTCAVTARTKDFALLLASGRLLNLDPGGNTLAWQGLQATAQGRAMLNGEAPGMKPAGSMLGYIDGSTLVVQSPVEVWENLPAPSSGSATRTKPAH
jgi:hypothetical protein